MEAELLKHWVEREKIDEDLKLALWMLESIGEEKIKAQKCYQIYNEYLNQRKLMGKKTDIKTIEQDIKDMRKKNIDTRIFIDNITEGFYISKYAEQIKNAVFGKSNKKEAIKCEE